MCAKFEYAKFQLFSGRKTFSNWGRVKRVRKMCVFQRKTDHISKTVRDTASQCYYQSLTGSDTRFVRQSGNHRL